MEESEYRKYDCLIIGKIPPPIGGVTIHVQRLLDTLKNKGFEYKFMRLELSNLSKIILTLFKYKFFHLHASNVYIQFLFSLISKLSGKNSIITYHCDLSRYAGFKNRLLLLSVRLSKYPIVLNENSFKIALNHNKNSQQISSFIPPINEKPITEEIINKINKLRSRYSKVFATNAYGIKYDKNNTEIYGILDLIEVFNNTADFSLIISDPSGDYYEYCIENKISVNQNILILNFPHSFCEVLKLSDASIRNTSTDGDSLSIKESLYYNKLTFATNVVSRNQSVITYKRGDYSILFKNIEPPLIDKSKLDGSVELIKLYNKIINEANHTVL
ncbi:hypothetical protein [Albibacterium sp.]|uniref:hypothetical protein n=1 Tax=Albibacterium sp. TaxID=2952885 RepID=UPI002B5ED48D|nr:hypothetical protein [Albibacterium sp.]HUH18942.1 hypothetical protein [Albibacterium sp.]